MKLISEMQLEISSSEVESTLHQIEQINKGLFISFSQERVLEGVEVWKVKFFEERKNL